MVPVSGQQHNPLSYHTSSLDRGGLSDAGRCGVLYESTALWFSGSRDASLESGYQ